MKPHGHHRKNSSIKNLNESDIITFLDKYFVDFEDNLRGNNFEKMNLLLVKSIIEKFSKIFQLWDENRYFQNSIDKKHFENIHKSMLYCFTANNDRDIEPIIYDSDDFTLECVCNHCGEAFPLRNKDCRYSYESHKISEEHMEFLGNLNIDTDSDALSSSDSNEIETDPVSPYEQLFIYAICNLCFERLTFGDLNYKEEEAAATKCILAHLETQSHRHNFKLFRDNKRYVEEVNLKKNIFNCTICDQILYLDKLINHFKSDEHKAKVVSDVGVTDSKDDCFSEDQDGPLLQPLRRGSSWMNNEANKLGEMVSFQLAKFCNVKGKSEVVTPAKQFTAGNKLVAAPIAGPISLSTSKSKDVLISVFDASCFVFRNNSLRCKICLSKILHESHVIPHMKGKLHLKMTKLYETYGHFSKDIDNKVQCTICECDFNKYCLFFNHCQSKNHQEKVDQLKIQPSKFLIQSTVAGVLQCPVFECSTVVSNLKQLFKHVKSFHVN